MTASIVLGDGVEIASTRNLPRSAWLQLRRRGIGGSDAAAVAGQHPRRSAFEVWLDKTGALPFDDDVRDSEAAEWGRILEPIVAERTAAKTGIALHEVHALLAHHERTWQLANIDRAAVDDRGERGVYEGKTAGFWAGREWGDDTLPDSALIQGMHYLAVTGLRWVLFGALVAGQRHVIHRVDRDDELVAHLTSIEATFWEHVLAGEPPAPDGSRATTELLAHLYDVRADAVVTVDPVDVEALLEQRAFHKAEEKASAERAAQAENALKVLIGEHEIAAAPDGRVLFTWKQTPGGWVERFERKPSRRFYVPKKKGA